MTCAVYAQTSDTVAIKQNVAAGDDPSQFFTRIEIYNELQHYNGYYLNQAVLRTIIKIGKRFTTRLDIPYVSNSFPSASKYKSSGIGDISFRVLGYKIMEKQKSALTASVEISLNTAQSRLLGTGKNLFIPVVTYSKLIPRQKMILAIILQQVLTINGDKSRSNLSFSKIQPILLKLWSKRTWTVVAPSWYIDYINGGLSMNMEGRFVWAPTPRINIWAQAGAGIFGKFIGRYEWSGQIGCRYFLLRSMNFKKK